MRDTLDLVSLKHLIEDTTFVYTPEKIGKEVFPEFLTIVDDKFGSPTYTADISRGILNLIKTCWFGTYHMVGTGGYCSRLEYAQAILDFAGVRSCELRPVSSAAFPLSAPRPRMEAGRNYHLDLMRSNWMRPWRTALQEYVQQLGE